MTHHPKNVYEKVVCIWKEPDVITIYSGRSPDISINEQLWAPYWRRRGQAIPTATIICNNIVNDCLKAQIAEEFPHFFEVV